MKLPENSSDYFSTLGKVVIVVDTTWGDGGKGKIVESSTSFFDVVVRYAGGPNAGHTVIHNGETFKFHGLPSSIVHPGTLSVVGPGVVVNPNSFVKELEQTREKGIEISPKNLLISHNAQLIMPWHQKRDALSETARSKQKIGTTLQGISPAYQDLAGRTGLLMKDLLLDEKKLREKFDEELSFQEKLAQAFDSTTKPPHYDGDKIFTDLLQARVVLKPFIGDALDVVWQAQKNGKRILGEGAQGALLDVVLGGRPYVTSSHPGRSGFEISTGIYQVDDVIGVTKAYATRVGEGPMPTELFDATGDAIREAGGEFGATTGRPRRCGWFDGVAVKYGAKISGTTVLAVTKLDILDQLEEVKICVGYNVDGTPQSDVTNLDVMARAIPIYETLPGWKESTVGIKRWSELPENAKSYLKRIEDVVGLPIEIASIGPGREDAVYRRGKRKS